MKFKAIIYLNPIKNTIGEEFHPVAYSEETDDRKSALKYAEELMKNQAIVAYRIAYSPNEGKGWYNDTYVKYLPEKARVVGALDMDFKSF